MSEQPVMLKVLLRDKHWQNYSTERELASNSGCIARSSDTEIKHPLSSRISPRLFQSLKDSRAPRIKDANDPSHADDSGRSKLSPSPIWTLLILRNYQKADLPRRRQHHRSRWRHK
jgi:hypothetical protein